MDISKNIKRKTGRSRRENICEEKEIHKPANSLFQNHDDRANHRATTASDADHSIGFSADAAPVKVAMVADEVVVL